MEVMTVIDQHCTIIGVTGSGKTYFTQHTIKNRVTPFTIFVNTNDDASAREAADLVINSPDELMEVFQNYESADMCYSISENVEEAKQELTAIKDILFAIGRQINRTSNIKMWLTLYVDEATDYSGKTQPDETINLLFRRGRRHGLIMVALTQRPAITSHTVLTQSRMKVFFVTELMERPYLEKYFGDAFDEYWDWLEKDFHYVEEKKGVWIKQKPIRV